MLSIRYRHSGILVDVIARLQPAPVAAEIFRDVSAVLEAVHDVFEGGGMRKAERVTGFMKARQIHDRVAQQPVVAGAKRGGPHINLRAALAIDERRPSLAI